VSQLKFKVRLTIAGVEFEHKFIIADQITVDAILGLDFLEAKGRTLDLAKGEMSVGGITVILTSHSTKTAVKSTKATLADTVIVPASSEMEVLAHVDSTVMGTGLVEYNEPNQLTVCVARVVVGTPSEAVPVRIVNTSLAPTT